MAATYSSLVGLAVGGKYEIRRVLGIGGMGVVCEAINVDLHKRVALKLIDKSMKESELIVERFRREARAAGQIQSEHIVDVFDIGADARVGLYMVMEHLTGEDLQTRLERDKKLDVSTAVTIGHQIARGLAKAHAAGVIHRDLKPANVFLTARDNGQLLVKLLDFGVSKLLLDEGSARITGSGAPIGTPLYMSPEQAEGKSDVDGRADIWSLGAVLYEALSGEPPFQDRGSYHGTIVGILTSRPRLLKAVAPWVPAEICGVVDALLVHDRAARIKDADTVTKRLLEAYPAVLPDGTGRHTAVIVSQAAAAIDATGDTEIFSGLRISGESPSRPPSHPSASPSPPPVRHDPTKTVPEPPRDRLPSSAGTTKAATDVRGRASDGETLDEPWSSPSGITKRPKTEPFAKAHPSSSAGGVALPTTPAEIDPLPMSRVPDTERDLKNAVRAERKRWSVMVAIAATLVVFSIAGFFLGREASLRDATREPARPQTVAAPPPPPVVLPATPETATASAASASPALAASDAPPPPASASAARAPVASAPRAVAPRPVVKAPKRAPAAPKAPAVQTAAPAPEGNEPPAPPTAETPQEAPPSDPPAADPAH